MSDLYVLSVLTCNRLYTDTVSSLLLSSLLLLVIFLPQLIHRQTQLSCTILILTRARTWIEQALSSIGFCETRTVHAVIFIPYRIGRPLPTSSKCEFSVWRDNGSYAEDSFNLHFSLFHNQRCEIARRDNVSWPFAVEALPLFFFLKKKMADGGTGRARNATVPRATTRGDNGRSSWRNSFKVMRTSEGQCWHQDTWWWRRMASSAMSGRGSSTTVCVCVGVWVCGCVCVGGRGACGACRGFCRWLVSRLKFCEGVSWFSVDPPF